MKFLLKVIILFLIIFNFRLPVVYNSCVIAVIITAFYYVLYCRSFPVTYFFYKYNGTILVATFSLAVIIVFITVMHHQYQYLMLKRVILVFFMLCCLIFALPIMIEDKSTAFKDAIVVICGAFALQGLIHTLGFMIAPVGDWLFSLQSPQIREAMLDPTRNIEKFRAYSLTGSPFFELPAAYGLACVLFFRLQLEEDQEFLTGWKSYAIMFLILMGISLSGRTGFIGFFIGLFLWLIFNWGNSSLIFKNIEKLVGICILLTGLFYIFLSPKQRQGFTDDLFPFAFEAYYNYRDKGSFSTGSSDELIQGHYYPIRSETLIFGEGADSDHSREYRHTDAGYMNNLIFGGIFYVLCLIIYQGLYIVPPMLLARSDTSRQKRIDFYCFLSLFAYMFILEYKAVTMGTQHLTEVLLLFAGITYIVEYDALEKKKTVRVENKPSRRRRRI